MPFRPEIPYDPTPHCSSRDGFDITGTVIHFTAGASMAGSISWCKDPRSQASWHFIIDRDGSVSQQVELDKAAWHAGISQGMYKGKLVRGVNPWTIGIELCNHGLLHRNEDGTFCCEDGNNLVPYKGATPLHAELRYKANNNVITGYWEPFREPQLLKLQWLLDQLKTSGYGTAASNLMGHEEVGMPVGRKEDPGGVFPWARFGRPPGIRLTETQLLLPAVS